jgi:uronate dehydrogenase
MRVLITCAGSELGQVVTDALAPEHQLLLTDRGALSTRHEFLMADLGHDEATANLVRGVDAVVHVAEPTSPTPQPGYIDDSTRRTYNLLHAAAQAGVGRVVYLSTLELLVAYSADYLVTEQWQPLATTNTEVLGKYLGERVCREFAREFKFSVVVLRLGRRSGALPGATGVAVLEKWTTSVSDGEVARAVRSAMLADVPRWSVFHIQGVGPNARFPVDEAMRVLGYVPDEAEEAP